MNSRLQVSKICFGCEPLGGVDWGEVNVNAIAEAVEQALDIGINFFDTADVYGLGLSEARLADILGSRRHDVLIATKGGLAWERATMGSRALIRRDSSPRHLIYAVEASLRRLRIDQIPIYFVHWPDPNTDIRVTFECLAQLQQSGKIGRIGCSNFDATQIRLACEVADLEFLQLPLNILGDDLDPEILRVVREKSLHVVAYNVLATGLLTGKYRKNTHFSNNDRRSRLPLFQGEAYQRVLLRVNKFSSEAEKIGITCAQYSISRIIDREEVASVILGIKNCSQLKENTAIFLK